MSNLYMPVLLVLYILMKNLFLMGFTNKFIYGSSWIIVQLCLMSIFSLMLILMYEKNMDLGALSFLVVLFSFLFFMSMNILVMFIFFELVSMPVILMIYAGGSQPEKLLAIYYMIIYTGAVSMLFMYVIMNVDIMNNMYSALIKMIVVGLFLAKSPVFFLHSWLPKAHVEAPTVASMLLAGVLLKVGLYGLMKMFTYMKISLLLMFYMSLLGFCLSPFLSLFSVDSKQYSAYSSITHMNLLINTLIFFSCYFGSGSYLVGLSHGYISSVLFLIVGELYNKNLNRLMYYVNGVLVVSGLLMLFFSAVLLGNAGVPPNLSFWGELLLILSLVSVEFLFFFLLSLYFLFSFYYSMYLLVRMMNKSTSNIFYGSTVMISVGMSVLPLLMFIMYPL